MPIVGISISAVICCGEVGRNTFEHECVGACVGHRFSVHQDTIGRAFGFALDAKAAHCVNTLRCQTDVAP